MKKRILTIALVVALLATCFAGTYAYLMDSEAQTNTFTTGTVYIVLDEAAVKLDGKGDLVEDTSVPRVAADQTYHLYPAMSVTKDPKITVKKGSMPAYVAAKVTVTGDLLSLIPMDGSSTMIDINKVVNGGLLEQITTYGTYNNLEVFQNDNYAVHQVAGTDGKTWTLYIFMKNVQDAKDQAVETILFTTLEIPEKWDNEEMIKVNGMNIKVEAFATQANGFTDCYTAMTKAFEDAFKFNQSPANP